MLGEENVHKLFCRQMAIHPHHPPSAKMCLRFQHLSFSSPCMLWVSVSKVGRLGFFFFFRRLYTTTRNTCTHQRPLKGREMPDLFQSADECSDMVCSLICWTLENCVNKLTFFAWSTAAGFALASCFATSLGALALLCKQKEKQLVHTPSIVEVWG